MIANVFEVLAKQLDAYFEEAPSRVFHFRNGNGLSEISSADLSATNEGEDNDPKVKIVSFLQQENQQEFIKFPLNKVTPILINVEEEAFLRPADRFSRVSATGSRDKVFPDIRLNLNILFVSHFFDYTDALYYLGLIVKFFQQRPIWDKQNTPDLHPEIEKLLFELITLPFSEQNEVWNSLRSAYHPSLLYRVKMLVFQDQPDLSGPPETTNLNIETKGLE